MEGYERSTYGDRFADVYDDWYGHVTDVDACTAHLAALVERTGGGPALELGVGSGRLALPLAARGVEVHGIDASPAMLELLRAKQGGSEVTVALGDMAELELPDAPAFSVVFAAFNTFFNLPTAAEQARCLARVADVLAPDGRFVLEAFVPDERAGTGREDTVTPRRIAADEVVLAVTSVDHDAQTITGSHVHLTEGGTRLRPWHLRWATPGQLDDMADGAGLALEQRAAGWHEEPFTEESTLHVSTYRLARPR